MAREAARPILLHTAKKNNSPFSIAQIKIIYLLKIDRDLQDQFYFFK